MDSFPSAVVSPKTAEESKATSCSGVERYTFKYVSVKLLVNSFNDPFLPTLLNS